MFHTATLLAGGKVLITGGFYGQSFYKNGKIGGVYGGIWNTAEIFDPKTNLVTCVGGKSGSHCVAKMKNSRAGHTATLMKTGALAGKVLLAGGIGGPVKMKMTGSVLATAEYFNPANSSFTATGKLKSTRAFHAAVLVQ
jgi:hypothetical protein